MASICRIVSAFLFAVAVLGTSDLVRVLFSTVPHRRAFGLMISTAAAQSSVRDEPTVDPALYLMGSVESADDGVTEGAREVFQDLNARWHPLRDRLEVLMSEKVAIFNDAVREAGIQPVEVPRRPLTGR